MKIKSIFLFVIFLIFSLFFGVNTVVSAGHIDTDNDGISDYHELNKYFTNPNNQDTDEDGIYDRSEIINWDSPRVVGKKMSEVDTDGDGLNDELEIRFKSSLMSKDTDNDGFDDKYEVDNEFDPNDPLPNKLPKKLVISLKNQRLSYYLGDVKLGEFIISTGRNNTTPKGEFKIGKKHPRAWSRLAGLWMPYWMPFIGQMYGIHELPEWPNGYKEGKNHLGTPVSHGCVRLGVGDAEFLYNWVPEGTKLIIQ